MAAAATGTARTLALLWAQCDDACARKLCDVRLSASLFAHSFVLAAASPVLATALSGASEDGTIQQPPLLADASPDVRRAALALIYGVDAATTRLCTDQLVELARLCKGLAMPDQVLAAIDADLAKRVERENVTKVPSWLPDAHAASRRMLKTKLPDIAHSKVWTEMPVRAVAATMRTHDLMPNAEEQVFRALERWLAADLDKRTKDACTLLRLIRFPTMSDGALLRVARSPFFANNNEFYQLLLEAFIRRADVRLVQMPRINTDENRARWRRAGVTDTSIGIVAPGDAANMRDQREVLFEGVFPLRWYKNMRFRTRSACSLLFTFVITGWSTKRRRVRSESRSFADHRWSLWVDPYASVAANEGATDESMYSDKDYISIFLCCEAENSQAKGEEGVAETVTNAPTHKRVDYSLFLVHAEEGYGMERKVCTGRSFTFSGQAMGFRRHTRRARAVSGRFYDAANDELVIGAQITVPGAVDAGVYRPDVEAFAAESELSKRSSGSSPESWNPNADDILRDLPRGATLNPAILSIRRSVVDPLIRGGSAVSDATAAEVVRNLSIPRSC